MTRKSPNPAAAPYPYIVGRLRKVSTSDNHDIAVGVAKGAGSATDPSARYKPNGAYTELGNGCYRAVPKRYG